MINTVTRRVFGLPELPEPPEIPKGFKVFLEHHGPDAEEKEASPRDVEKHVALTGALPVLGKPLYAAPAGMAVPYGKVTRIVNGH